MFSTLMSLEDRLRLKLKVKTNISLCMAIMLDHPWQSLYVHPISDDPFHHSLTPSCSLLHYEYCCWVHEAVVRQRWDGVWPANWGYSMWLWETTCKRSYSPRWSGLHWYMKMSGIQERKERRERRKKTKKMVSKKICACTCMLSHSVWDLYHARAVCTSEGGTQGSTYSMMAELFHAL